MSITLKVSHYLDELPPVTFSNMDVSNQSVETVEWSSMSNKITSVTKQEHIKWDLCPWICCPSACWAVSISLTKTMTKYVHQQRDDGETAPTSLNTDCDHINMQYCWWKKLKCSLQNKKSLYFRWQKRGDEILCFIFNAAVLCPALRSPYQDDTGSS